MAMVAQITINGVEGTGFNVSERVGLNGASNRRDNGDLMVVQAMLHIIAHHDLRGPNPGRIGLRQMDQVPEPTNTMDWRTDQAIEFYQRRFAHELLAVDGVVHPASYRVAGGVPRNVRTDRPGDRLMTITHLHRACMATSLHTMQGGYVQQVLARFPRLATLLQKP
jgi:hypothetical protein